MFSTHNQSNGKSIHLARVNLTAMIKQTWPPHKINQIIYIHAYIRSRNRSLSRQNRSALRPCAQNSFTLEYPEIEKEREREMKQGQEEVKGKSTPSDEAMDCVSSSYVPILSADDWATIRDDDIMHQHSQIRNEEAEKLPFVSDKVILIPHYLPNPNFSFFIEISISI